MAQVFLKNITKIFDGNIVAVNKASIHIADEELMVVVGPSGCGKTTMLRMIAGLENATDGTIVIGDKVVDNVQPKDRNIAMVFQNHALYPHMTACQNMSFALKFRKIPKGEIDKRVQVAADILGISQLLNRKPKTLSGGQRQRVALGRAIVQDPSVFLFDEPLSNLDAMLRATMRKEIKSLHQRLKATCIYVTHDQLEAMTLGDRICVMYDGVVQQVGTPMQVYEEPINRFVAGFLGDPTMNFFNGRIRITQENVEFVFEDDSAVTIGGSKTENFRPFDGREMVLGIRPDDISLQSITEKQDDTIQAVIHIVEPLGNKKEVCLETRFEQKFTAVVAPYDSFKAGDTVAATFDLAKIHVFEPGKTGKNAITSSLVI